MTQKLFEFPIRVYYEDTDAGGVVYHANYLNFLERARTEWLRDLGHEQDDLRIHDQLYFVVRSAKINYLKPAKFNQQLCVTTEVTEIGKTHFTCYQQVLLDHEAGERVLLAEGTIGIVCVDAERFRPKRIPEKIIRLIQ